MNGCFRLILLAMFSLVTTTVLFARWTTQEEVARAATATLAKPSFQTRFPNATIASVVDLGDLWCVNLAPHGHLIFAASTKQMPLLAYATGAYITPNEKNPEFTLLSGMRTRAKQLESQTVATFSTTLTPAEAAWAALLNPQPKVQLLTATEEEEEDELPVQVVLPDENEWNPDWSQWEPWNDFCPQFGAEVDTTNKYHNRAPVGCVVTMYTQIMKYYEWPQRIDVIYAETLPTLASVLKDKNGNRIDYDMRFHGGLPIEWNTLKDHYWFVTEGGETPVLNKNYTTERERFDVARLGLLMDIIAKMRFDSVDNDGSGATLLDGCSNDWYDFGSPGEKAEDGRFTEAQLDEIKTVLVDGMPLPATVPGHAIFICGYEDHEDGNTYLLLNYGWNQLKHDDGTESNRYYLAGTEEDDVDDTTQLSTWLLGNAPKVQVQVAPLPKVVDVNTLPTLMWMVPEYHAADFKAFTVSATPYSASETTNINTIDAFTDVTADEEIYEVVTLQDPNGNQAKALTINASEYGLEVYTFPEAFIPTEKTTFSFNITDLRDDTTAPFNTRVNVQLWNEVDMTWQTLATFPDANQDLPEAIALPLSNAANRFCKLRLTLSMVEDENEEEEEEEEGEGNEEEENGNDESAQPYYALSHITLSNVCKPGTPITKKIKTATTRELALTDLMTVVGARYRIKVDATTAEDPVHFGETFTRLTNETVAMPIIQSVTTMEGEKLIDDILLKGDLYGISAFRVICNEAVTELRVWPSCTTLVPDSAITIKKSTNENNASVFDISIQSPKFDSQTLDALDGSRMILTLEARTGQGNVVYQDIALALRTVIEWDVDEETLEIPRAWFREYALAGENTAVEDLTLADLKTLATADADNDGLLNWQEYLCGTNPTDATEKLQITGLIFNEEGTLEKVSYTPETSQKGLILLEGKTTLTDATWDEADLTKHRFFRLYVTTK